MLLSNELDVKLVWDMVDEVAEESNGDCRMLVIFNTTFFRATYLIADASVCKKATAQIAVQY